MPASKINHLSPAQNQLLRLCYGTAFSKYWDAGNLWRHCCTFGQHPIGTIMLVQPDHDTVITAMRTDNTVDVLGWSAGVPYYPMTFVVECTRKFQPEDDTDESLATEVRDMVGGVFHTLTSRVLLTLEQAAKVAGGLTTLPYRQQEFRGWLDTHPTADTLVLSRSMLHGVFTGDLVAHEVLSPAAKHDAFTVGHLGEICLPESGREIKVFTDGLGRRGSLVVWDRTEATAVLFRREDVHLWELDAGVGDLTCLFSYQPDQGDEVTVQRGFALAVSGPVSIMTVAP